MATNERAPLAATSEAQQNQHDSVGSVARAGDGGNATLEAALAYAGRGWHVLPVDAAKRPLVAWGAERTTDVEIIRGWWARWPHAGVAIATKPSGLVVVDIDVLDAWAAVAGTEPDGCGLVASTPRGGRHLFYAAPIDGVVRTTTARWPGIDIRAAGGEHGGYVVAPPAPGREWQVGDPLDDGDLQPMPSWLAEHLVEQEHQAAPTGTPSPARHAGTASAARLAEVASALPHVDPSEDRNRWLAAIYAVHAALDGDPAGAELVERWSATTDVAGQYKSGEASSIYRATRAPGPGDRRPKVDAGTLFAAARRNGWTRPQVDPADLPPFLRESAETQARQSAESRPLPPGAVGWHETGLCDAFGSPIRFAVDKFGEPIAEPPEPEYQVRTLDAELARAPMEWRIDGWLPETGIGFLAADPSAGKTFVALDLSLRLVYGRAWFGRPVEPCSAVYLYGEGGGGIAGRLRAWHAQHNPTAAERGNRWLATIEGIPPLAAANRAHYDSVLDRIAREHGSAPGLIVVDTFSTALAEGDENDSAAVVPAMRLLQRIARRHGCAVLAVHHLRKAQNTRGSARPAGDTAPTVDDLRGSGALRGGSDYVWLAVRSPGGGGVLRCAKTKDGQEPPPIAYELVGVETGARRRNGEPERSAIVVAAAAPAEAPDPAAAVAAEQQRRQAALLEKVEQAVQVAGSLGPATKTAIAVAMTGRRADRYAAIDLAVGTGRLAWRGTARDRVLFVCVVSPHTPLVPGTGDLQCPQSRTVPGGLAGTSGDCATQEGPDVGQPEQPKRRRAKSKRRK